MKLYRTPAGVVLVTDEKTVLLPYEWDSVFNTPDLASYLQAEAARLPAYAFIPDETQLLAPIVNQEVWAAGVTYYRSRDARMEEQRESGGGDFYAKVYEAERPELFFKATPHRVVGHRGQVRIRADSNWNVPEPELAICITAEGHIIGYSVSNDMSSRDIEGENPLYLPQAKIYDGCCALGPCLLVAEEPLPPSTRIEMTISRGGAPVFEGATTIDQIKRGLDELASWLYREQTFPHGAILSTGTGVVPPDDFTLRSGDEIRMTIAPIGTLVSTVA